MFCPKCGKEIADDSQFCSKCGRVLASSSSVSTPSQKRKSSGGWVGALVLLALIAVIGVFWLKSGQTNTATGSQSSFALPLIPTPHTQVITNSALTVRASGYTYYKFIVPPGATNVSVYGRFTATGGTGNDIEVFVLSDDGFVNFQNGHGTSTYYNSGKLTQASINAALPGTGTYYLVFNNGFSLITPKAVQATVTLHFTS